MMNKIYKNKKVCCYCGEKNAVQKDHVPPKCFFSKNEKKSKNQLITVPSCNDCHREYSTIDEKVKYLTGLAIANLDNINQHPDWLPSLSRTITKHNKFSSRIRQSKKEFRYAKNGILLPHRIVNINEDDIAILAKFFKRLTQAFFWKKYGKYLKNSPTQVTPIVSFTSKNPMSIVEFNNTLDKFVQFTLFLNKVDNFPETFTYWHGQPTDKNDTYVFVYMLKKCLVYMVTINP